MINSREDFVFPVKVPYSTAPDIVKLIDEFNLTSISNEVLAFKLEELNKFQDDLAKEIRTKVIRLSIHS